AVACCPAGVDGPRLARENVTCRTEVACSHVSGLFTQSGWTAGPDGVHEPRPHHSSVDRCPNETTGFSRLRRIDRLYHHASLLSCKLQTQCRGRLSGHSPGLPSLPLHRPRAPEKHASPSPIRS